MPGHNKPAGVQRMNIQALQLERQTLNSIDASQNHRVELLAARGHAQPP